MTTINHILILENGKLEWTMAEYQRIGTTITLLTGLLSGQVSHTPDPSYILEHN